MYRSAYGRSRRALLKKWHREPEPAASASALSLASDWHRKMSALLLFHGFLHTGPSVTAPTCRWSSGMATWGIPDASPLVLGNCNYDKLHSQELKSLTAAGPDRGWMTRPHNGTGPYDRQPRPGLLASCCFAEIGCGEHGTCRYRNHSGVSRSGHSWKGALSVDPAIRSSVRCAGRRADWIPRGEMTTGPRHPPRARRVT